MDQRSAREIVNKYLQFLKENKIDIRKAYLFGSYAKGASHEDSDIDIAIILKDLKDDFDMQVHLMKLRRDFDTRIEPHPFDEESFPSGELTPKV